MRADSYTDLLHVYEQSRRIAVVGCSTTWPKPSHVVPAYLQSQGFRIVPVNPHEQEVLGEPAFAELRDVDVPVDVVEVFRPAEEAPAIASDAVALGARYLWLQIGIVSEEAARIAEEGGLTVVMDRCMGIVHGELGLGPGVHPWMWKQRPGDVAGERIDLSAVPHSD
jgi:uncharacterized protein